MSVEKRAGLWLVVRPETEFCHCNLTLCFCNDSPGGTNDFLHWCCYCWSHRKFKRKAFFGEGGGVCVGTAAFHFTFCLSSWSYRSRGPTAVNVPQFSIPGPFFLKKNNTSFHLSPFSFLPPLHRLGSRSSSPPPARGRVIKTSSSLFEGRGRKAGVT